jgi:hypothetical protein
MKDKNVKHILSRGGYQWEGGRHKRGRKANRINVFCNSCMKIEQQKLLNCSKKWRKGGEGK